MTLWVVLYNIGKILLFVIECGVAIVLIVLLIAIIETMLLSIGFCHDFYMSPFRFLKYEKRMALQNSLDEIVNKTNYRGKLTVKIYFFRGLIHDVPLAFCVGNAKTVFIQNWLLKNAGAETVKFILCHEFGHIFFDHANKSPCPNLHDECEADLFAASILGTDAGVMALQKTMDLIAAKYRYLSPNVMALVLMPAFSEIDMRIENLKRLKKTE